MEAVCFDSSYDETTNVTNTQLVSPGKLVNHPRIPEFSLLKKKHVEYSLDT